MLKTIDLFAGAGGLSFGFQLAGGYKIVAAAEINKYARETYKANIAQDDPSFVFIENVQGYDFVALNERLGGIDIVIGGPPCQGFSNANRQKNHIISMNNGLVKEYFRAIKEIRPKAFVMENVSMLRSDTHRFYESAADKDQIDTLIKAGFSIPTRDDTLLVADRTFEGIDYDNLDISAFQSVKLPDDLAQLIAVLNKNLNNDRRLPTYLEKHINQIITKTKAFVFCHNSALKGVYRRDCHRPSPRDLPVLVCDGFVLGFEPKPEYHAPVFRVLSRKTGEIDCRVEIRGGTGVFAGSAAERPISGIQIARFLAEGIPGFATFVQEMFQPVAAFPVKRSRLTDAFRLRDPEILVDHHLRAFDHPGKHGGTECTRCND